MCYQELLDREPKNIEFKIGKLETLIKLKNSVEARVEFSDIKAMRKISEEDLTKYERKI